MKQIHIWVYNSRGQILMRVRKEDRRLEAPVAGIVLASEYPGIAAMREIADGLGIIAHPKNFRLVSNANDCFLYLCKFEGDIYTLTTKRNVLRILTIQALEQELDDQQCVVYSAPYYATLLNSLRSLLII